MLVNVCAPPAEAPIQTGLVDRAQAVIVEPGSAPIADSGTAIWMAASSVSKATFVSLAFSVQVYCAVLSTHVNSPAYGAAVCVLEARVRMLLIDQFEPPSSTPPSTMMSQLYWTVSGRPVAI